MPTTFRLIVVLTFCCMNFNSFGQSEALSLCERQLALIEQMHDFKRDSINKVYAKKISIERKKINQASSGKSKAAQKSAKKSFAKRKDQINQSKDLALRLASVKITQMKSSVSLNCSTTADNSRYTEPKVYASINKAPEPVPTPKAIQKETTVRSFEPEKVTLKNESIIKEARRYLGVPYRWGGNSPKSGFDCSGFICYVYNKMGKQLPRTTDQMANEGKRTQVDRVEPGDLIFFSHKGRGIDHVGMVVQNNGQQLHVIHASSSSGVVITDIKSSSYWKNRVRKAIKVL